MTDSRLCDEAEVSPASSNTVYLFDGRDSVFLPHVLDTIETEQDEVKGPVSKDPKISGIADLEPICRLDAAKSQSASLKHFRRVVDPDVFLDKRANVRGGSAGPDANVQDAHVDQLIA